MLSTQSPPQPDASTRAGDSLLGKSSPAAGLLCLTGFFLHIILSDPLLNSIGIRHSDEGGHFYERLHPGTVLIFMSFFILLVGRGGVIRRFCTIARQHTAFAVLLVLTALLTVYMALRSGASGITFMVDTHLTPPICAIVLCYTPLSYCRKALYGFIMLAVVNSCVGIAESIGRFRIFTFDPDWVVLHEAQFRASAFLGHPLNNAMFTSAALFVALALRIRVAIKGIIAAVFLTSLVAFGGRGGLAFSVVACLAYFLITSLAALYRGRLTLAQVFLLLAALVAVPAVVLGGGYLLVTSSMGERIATHARLDDESAEGRHLALLAFDYLRGGEMVFGVSQDRIKDITYRLHLAVPLSDIENPWILMFMTLGGLMFPFWLAATLGFIWRLMRGQPWALKLAVLSYFLVASTSNSFGRKDSTYLIMVSAVICAARVLASSPGRLDDGKATHPAAGCSLPLI